MILADYWTIALIDVCFLVAGLAIGLAVMRDRKECGLGGIKTPQQRKEI